MPKFASHCAVVGACSIWPAAQDVPGRKRNHLDRCRRAGRPNGRDRCQRSAARPECRDRRYGRAANQYQYRENLSFQASTSAPLPLKGGRSLSEYVLRTDKN